MSNSTAGSVMLMGESPSALASAQAQQAAQAEADKRLVTVTLKLTAPNGILSQASNVKYQFFSSLCPTAPCSLTLQQDVFMDSIKVTKFEELLYELQVEVRDQAA